MASSHFENKKSTTEMGQPLAFECHRGCGWKQAAGDREAVGAEAQRQCWQCVSREGRGADQKKYTVSTRCEHRRANLRSSVWEHLLLSKQELLPREQDELCPEETDRELQRQEKIQLRREQTTKVEKMLFGLTPLMTPCSEDACSIGQPWWLCKVRLMCFLSLPFSVISSLSRKPCIIYQLGKDTTSLEVSFMCNTTKMYFFCE